MEKLFEWVAKHRMLAIIGGAGILFLLWIMFRGGSAPQQDGGTSALTAYYAASAAASGDAAAVSQSTNALAAATNQTNAAADVAKANIAAQADALKLQVNQAAYRDYLSERAMSGTASTAGTLPANLYDMGLSMAGTEVLWNRATSRAGSTLTDWKTGATEGGGNQTQGWDLLAENWHALSQRVTWSGVPGEKPVPYNPTPPPPAMTFAQFMASMSNPA